MQCLGFEFQRTLHLCESQFSSLKAEITFAKLGCHRKSCLAAFKPDGGATPLADSSGCLLSHCLAEGSSAGWATTRLLAFPRWVGTTWVVLAITGVGSMAGGCHQPSHKVVLLEHVKPALLLKLSCAGKPCAVFASRSVLVPSLSCPWCPLGFPAMGWWLWGEYPIIPPFLYCSCICAWQLPNWNLILCNCFQSKL